MRGDAWAGKAELLQRAPSARTEDPPGLRQRGGTGGAGSGGGGSRVCPGLSHDAWRLSGPSLADSRRA